MISWLLIFGLYFICMNLWAYSAMRSDKRRALTGDWRLSEFHLWLLAFAGGWFGAKRAQRVFRHKTRKEPFRSRLNRIPRWWLVSACLVTAGVQYGVLPHRLPDLTLPSLSLPDVSLSEMDWSLSSAGPKLPRRHRKPPKFFKSAY
ncbi:DUF1294 domain-containing protein [Arenibacterium halophilum]|uniref:DUF1294 domain-containing protein n=1 Tax=Arenibacterium halophilum TaxID=2583821 RepID=A0ABY2X8L6_9RHOB|nr:DUF1294 domain-containing protein [Arenibacterium halophilum]TMV11667.1 DUF1294 domain-containing protein [Arenibacterium halophilum]